MTYPASSLRQTATVKHIAIQGMDGPIYGTATNLRCYIELSNRRFSDPAGIEIVCNAVMVCAIGTVIGVDDEVAFRGVRYDVVGVDNTSDDHVEVMLKSAAADTGES
jgi:hypothetical protein